MMKVIPIRDSKETNDFFGGSENCAVRRWKGPGAFLKWRRFSSVVVLAPRHRHALPFQEIAPAFGSFETLLGIRQSARLKLRAIFFVLFVFCSLAKSETTKLEKDDGNLEELQAAFLDLAQTPRARGLEKAMNAYVREYLKNNSPEQFKELFFSSPLSHFQNKGINAVFRVAFISVCEGDLRSIDVEKEAQKARKTQVIIRVLYEEIRNDFALQDLPNFVLVKVGDFIRKETTLPRDALVYYEEVLQRSDHQVHKLAAIFGMAEIKSKGEEAGDLDEALVAYQQIFASSRSVSSKYDTAAVLAWMKLLWARKQVNQGKSDRQYSYEKGLEYLKLTERAAKKATAEEKATREKLIQLVALYEASPDTTQVEE